MPGELRCSGVTRKYLNTPPGREWARRVASFPTNLPKMAFVIDNTLPDGLIEVWNDDFVILELEVF